MRASSRPYSLGQKQEDVPCLVHGALQALTVASTGRCLDERAPGPGNRAVARRRNTRTEYSEALQGLWEAERQAEAQADEDVKGNPGGPHGTAGGGADAKGVTRYRGGEKGGDQTESGGNRYDERGSAGAEEGPQGRRRLRRGHADGRGPGVKSADRRSGGRECLPRLHGGISVANRHALACRCLLQVGRDHHEPLRIMWIFRIWGPRQQPDARAREGAVEVGCASRHLGLVWDGLSAGVARDTRDVWVGVDMIVKRFWVRLARQHRGTSIEHRCGEPEN